MSRIVTWTGSQGDIGLAVVAIGVFDGVHLGHQALLRAAVADARAREVQSVAVTFDRDPDQVVSPQTAAPQLLALEDKLRFIGDTGIDAVLVVPFDERLARMAPESFLETVLVDAVSPVAVHVGTDFRFGFMATGDVSTLRLEGARRGFDVVPHDLVTLDGEAVTSTRIRSCVARGALEQATRLLGRPTRVRGHVHHGRGEGDSLGFPTANVEPLAFSALPPAGVYAGRVALPDGAVWTSAISVGRPPMFPEAVDVLEAHLIGFTGNLYDTDVTVEFWERLRDQRSYPSLDELKEAIAADVERALDISGFTDEELAEQPGAGTGAAVLEDSWDSNPVTAFSHMLFSDDDVAAEPDYLEDGTPVVEDPEVLEAAEEAARHAPSVSLEDISSGAWSRLLGPITIYGGPESGAVAFGVSAPLDAAGVPYAWDPFPPAEMTAATGGRLSRQFTLLVPTDRLDEARGALEEAESPYLEGPFGPPAASDDDHIDDPAALEAAEEAVRTADAGLRHEDRAPAGLVTVGREMPYDKDRLSAISYALAMHGIAAEWTPFEPAEAPLLQRFVLHDLCFSIHVDPADEQAAHDVIADVDAGRNVGE